MAIQRNSICKLCGGKTFWKLLFDERWHQFNMDGKNHSCYGYKVKIYTPAEIAKLNEERGPCRLTTASR